MRTGRSLTVCRSLRPGGSVPGGSAPRGVTAPRGVCSGSVSASRGCVCSREEGVCSGGWYPSMYWGRHPHPPSPWTEWQTRVKTLPVMKVIFSMLLDNLSVPVISLHWFFSDIDECYEYAKCPQGCSNTWGGYYCSCHDNYHKTYDADRNFVCISKGKIPVFTIKCV